jgi:hypothetical protein
VEGRRGIKRRDTRADLEIHYGGANERMLAQVKAAASGLR